MPEAARAQAFEALELTGAERRLPGALSGGMAQRVAFTAATTGGGTLIVITHEVGVARALSGQLLVLREGRVVERGETRAVLSAPRHAYTRELIAADPESWPRTAPATPGETLLRACGLGVARGRQTQVVLSTTETETAGRWWKFS